MGINPDDATAKENWNEFSHSQKLTTILMALHFPCEILVLFAFLAFLAFLASCTLCFFGWRSTDGVFSTPLPNSFIFEIRLLKFCTELLRDKMNILRQKKKEVRIKSIIIFSLLSIKMAKNSLF